jgi:hypothetical protein
MDHERLTLLVAQIMISYKALDRAMLLRDSKTGQIELPMPEGNPELRCHEVRPCTLGEPKDQANNPTGCGDASITHTLRLPLLWMCPSFEVADLHRPVGRILEAVDVEILETFDRYIRGKGQKHEKRDEITCSWEYPRMCFFQPF